MTTKEIDQALTTTQRDPELQACLTLAIHCTGFEGDFRVGIIRFRNVAHLLATRVLLQEKRIQELEALAEPQRK